MPFEECASGRNLTGVKKLLLPLYERANKALYRAKALGRNRVESVMGELVPLAPDASAEVSVTSAAA